MNKLFLFRIVVISLTLCLLVWDGLQIMSHSLNHLPEHHKEVLLTGALLWIASVFVNEHRNDDDWAGQF